MTIQSITRQQEIRNLWQQYQGLYVVVGILIGLLLFPMLELLIHDLSELLIGLIPEAIGIGFTVFFLDRIYQIRDVEQLKKRLINEAGSRSNETAKTAIDWLRHEGWLTGENGLLKDSNLSYASLEHSHLNHANLQKTNLGRANLNRAFLQQTNLESADLYRANLDGADLFRANLYQANLHSANLRGADLFQANLQYAKLNADFTGATLRHANLSNADLSLANLERANLFGAKFDGAVLPDLTEWTPETDMSRFTNPNHPNFWRPSNLTT